VRCLGSAPRLVTYDLDKNSSGVLRKCKAHVSANSTAIRPATRCRHFRPPSKRSRGMVLDSLSLTHSLRAKNESAASFPAFTFDANSGLKAQREGPVLRMSRLVILRRNGRRCVLFSEGRFTSCEPGHPPDIRASPTPGMGLASALDTKPPMLRPLILLVSA